jgi:hypothetical protein
VARPEVKALPEARRRALIAEVVRKGAVELAQQIQALHETGARTESSTTQASGVQPTAADVRLTCSGGHCHERRAAPAATAQPRDPLRQPAPLDATPRDISKRRFALGRTELSRDQPTTAGERARAPW